MGMNSIFLFDLTSQRNQWLSLRQTAISGNIANANTPGYQALDVAPFDSVLQTSQLELARSDAGHFGLSAGQRHELQPPQEDKWDVYDSGNSVSLEKEMVKAGDVNSAFALSNNVVRAFHRMLIASTKG
jgi:flagellar basal-body rod protein FlgB